MNDEPAMTDEPAVSDIASGAVAAEAGGAASEAASGVIEVERAATGRSGPGAGRVLLGLGIVVVIVLQVLILRQLDETTDDLDATRAAVAGLQVDVEAMDNQLAAVAEQVDGMDVAASGASPSGQANPVSVPAGSLPPFTDPQNDPAVQGGYVLGDLSAVEYYTDAVEDISPADGTARVWMVWAHWCPYCQQELPEVAAWWPENAERFPNTELVTITSSMDESRGNPLTPYLDTEQFPFPVLVDTDLAIATQFGTSAFPFWVVTDGEGKVVFRVAGAVGIDTVDAIFTQVEALSAGA